LLSINYSTLRGLTLLVLIFSFRVQAKEKMIVSTSYPVAAIRFLETGQFPGDTSPAHNKSRTFLVSGIHVAAYGGSLVIFNNAWYKNYARTSFHTFNDGREWLQLDKLGHSWGAYNAARGSSAMWSWAGLSKKKSAIIGGLSSIGYLTVIEFLDAYSVKWGWSWADMGANLAGAGLFISQELGWKEQRIQLKFSFHTKKYDDPQLEARADNLFGNSTFERILKDYNGQTYWLSGNIQSFCKGTRLPAWLNIAIGYGADGMFGGFTNSWTDHLGNMIERPDVARKRQFYLSLDVDLTKIKTKSRFLKTGFEILNSFKIPAPALMIDSEGKLKAYPLYF
jgi:hypothetical protein